MVVVSAEAGRADRAVSRAQAQQSELEQGVRADPLVQAVLARFPGAEIVGVRRRDEAQPPTCRRRATSRCRTRTTTAPTISTTSLKEQRWPISWA